MSPRSPRHLREKLTARPLAIEEGNMAGPASREVRQLARYQVRADALAECLEAIRVFVAYVRASEPGTLRYDVWREVDNPNRFVHVFVFRDAEAHRVHSASAEVKQFAATLYPRCLDPVEFVDYQHVDSKLDVLS